MKNILIAFLLLVAGAVKAQTHTVAADGTSFSINGKVFSRGTVVVDTPVNSTGMSIMSSDLKSVICYMTPYTNYKRAGGVAFASRRAFLAFADSFMFASSGGGGGAPSGPAGGDLAGTYPNPTLNPLTTAKIVATANLTSVTGAQTLIDYTPAAGRYVILVNTVKTTGRVSNMTLTWKDKVGVAKTSDLYTFADIGDPTITNNTMSGNYLNFFPVYISTDGTANITLTTTLVGTQSVDATLMKLP